MSTINEKQDSTIINLHDWHLQRLIADGLAKLDRIGAHIEAIAAAEGLLPDNVMVLDQAQRSRPRRSGSQPHSHQ
jgi:hypothetical protein